MNRSIRARSSVKPDRRKLSDVARHVVLPKDIVTTGWPKVEAQARLCGIEYDDWQRQLGRCILGKTSDGVYAAGIGGRQHLSSGRQDVPDRHDACDAVHPERLPLEGAVDRA